MVRSELRNLTWGALFVALGIIFPMLFHSIGAGPVFLPMHIPILLAGFLIGPAVGCVVGLVTPLLSAFLTGMPPLMPPKAQMMTVELAVYGFLAGLLYRVLRQNLVLSLVVAMIAGRVVYGLLGAYLLPMFGLKAIPVFYPITGGIVGSLPGIIIQLIFVPTIVWLIERRLKVGWLERRAQ
ncbi:MAG TPA: ECF transporter S component [Firmicutes bacterium]|nr:ECF transporter S component [Bacillota bacterium]